MLHSHKSFWISWKRTMIDASLHVIEGLLTLLTLGWLTYNMDFWYMRKCAKKDLRSRIKKQGGDTI